MKKIAASVVLIIALGFVVTRYLDESKGFEGSSISESEAGIEINLPLLDMEISDEERRAVLSSIKSAREISKISAVKNGKPFRRDAHAKATGCVKATFVVNENIPEKFQHSVFSRLGHEYKSWIRFSNGDMLVNPDGQGDARGMAVKLMGVSGEKIAPEMEGPTTQDFIMSNQKAFFHRNIFDYAQNLEHFAKLERREWFINLFPPRLRPMHLYRLLQVATSEIENPLEPQYFSILPYKLGETDLKFSVNPCSVGAFKTAADKDHEDFLTHAMATHLSTQDACFEFMVQERTSEKNMPMDDALKVWPEDESPYVPVAKIYIPQQEFTSEAQMDFCENISMNPWNGVGDWLPESSLNRARRLVYNAVAQFRTENNSVKRFQPEGWCLDGSDGCDISD